MGLYSVLIKYIVAGSSKTVVKGGTKVMSNPIAAFTVLERTGKIGAGY
jgi:hypothetical protein